MMFQMPRFMLKALSFSLDEQGFLSPSHQNLVGNRKMYDIIRTLSAH